MKAALTAILRRAKERHAISRCVLGISGLAIDEVIVCDETDLALHGSACIEDRFLLTSVTKAVTAAQIHTLVADGRLDPHAPVSETVPEFGANGKQRVTPFQILTHTSGVDPRLCNGIERLGGVQTRGHHFARLCQAPLASTPGTQVDYCSPPFWVLAELIERVSGMSYTQHYQERIAAPLGLESTRYEPGPLPVGQYVLPDDQDHRAVGEQVRQLSYPAGGLVGDTRDLLRFGYAHLEPVSGFLSADALAELSKPATVGLLGVRAPSEGIWPTQRTFGWAMGGPGNLRSDLTLWHSGSSGTSLWVEPERAVTIAFLSASWHPKPDMLAGILDGVLEAWDDAMRLTADAPLGG